MLRIFLLSAVLLILAAAPTRAGVDDLIETFKAWSVFASGSGKEKVCYMGSVPSKSEGDYEKRGDVHAWVAQQPGDDQYDVVQFVAGYTFKTRSEVTVTIGNDTFTLFTADDSAWARDVKTDQSLVRAMRAGTEMVVRGISSRGTETVDTYSLNGFTAAHIASRKACGL
ncbi:invasion associated locus B family protein [Magnetospira thiophila]